MDPDPEILTGFYLLTVFSKFLAESYIFVSKCFQLKAFTLTGNLRIKFIIDFSNL